MAPLKYTVKSGLPLENKHRHYSECRKAVGVAGVVKPRQGADMGVCVFSVEGEQRGWSGWIKEKEGDSEWRS